MTNANAKVLTTPVGEVLFSSLRKALSSSFKADTAEYSIRIEVDGDAKGATEFRNALKKLNKALVITEDKEGNSIVKKEGNYIINARSQNRPKVVDKNDNVLTNELVPMIESGTVRLLVTTFEGKAGKGGGINLSAVQLVDIVEFQGSEPLSDEETLAALKTHHS